MKNGLLKEENNILLPYTNADNINVNGISLTNYLKMLESKIDNAIFSTYDYKAYFKYSDQYIDTDDTLEKLTTFNITFNGRKNSINNNFTNDSGEITLTNIKGDLVYTEITFVSQCSATTSSNKQLKIEVIRDGAEIASEYSAFYAGASNDGMGICQLGYYAQKGDTIKFYIKGKNNDKFSKNSVIIHYQQRLDESTCYTI